MLNSVSFYTLIVFFILFFVLAFQYTKSRVTLAEYFLAKNSFNWFTIGFVAFITNTALPTFLTVSSGALVNGISIFNLELTGILSCIVLSLVFGRIYMANEIYTTPQYIERRFNSTTAQITSLLLILMYILSRISIILICLSYLAEFFLGIDMYTSSILMSILCGVYSFVGGQRTIIKIGFTVGWVMLIGGMILPYFLLTTSELSSKLENIPPNYFNLIHMKGESSFTWTGVLFGMPILGIWYHCINQELVQKFMGSKNYLHFQASAIFHGYLKLLVFPMVILVGVMGYFLCGNIYEDKMYLIMVYSYVPKSIQGILLCGLYVSGMIGLSASFNACSTLFTFDFYRKIYPTANNFVLTSIGKIATIVIVIVSMICVVMLQTLHNNIFLFVTSALTYLTSPFAVIFLTGVLWPRATPKAALYTLITGLIIGFLKFVLTFMNNNGWLTSLTWKYIAEYNFFNFTGLLCLFNLSTIIIFSYLGKAQKEETIATLLYKNNRKNELTLPSEVAFQNRIYIASAILLCIIISIYLLSYFSL